MRTLKKTLCLVLVLAMMAGLCMISASAVNYEKFTDADAVGEDYKEAVDAMIGAGVVAGTTATTLEPTGTYTREQAAKIVAYLALGQTAADKLTAAAAPFGDVAANRWSAGYIQYCVTTGIIAGYGNGNFGPADALSGYAFAKMLLCAMGYGQKGEYEGAAWEINVAKDALAVKSSVLSTKGNSVISKKNIAAATGDAITREQAIQMAFDAMQIYNVKYSALLSTYVEIGQNQYGGGNVTDPQVLMTNLGLKKSANAVIGYVAADKEYQIDGVPVDATYADAGRTAHVYYKEVKGQKVAVSDYYFTDKVVATSTNGTAVADLLDKSSTKYCGYPAAGDNVALYKTDETGLTVTAAQAVASFPTVVKGGEVKLISTRQDEKVNVVLYTEKAVGVVGAAGVKYSSDKKTATIAGVVSAYTDVKKMAGFEDLKKDDVVLYVKDPAGILRFEKAETFAGKMTNTTGSGSSIKYVIDSKSYDLSGLAANGVDTATCANVNANYFTDNYGYIVYGKAVEEALSDYVILLGIDQKQQDLFTGIKVYANLLKMDGTTEVVQLSKIGTDKIIYEDSAFQTEDASGNKANIGTGTATAASDEYDNTFYTYKIVKGAYELTAVNGRDKQDSKTAASGLIKNNVSAIVLTNKTVYANNATVYICKGTAAGTYKTVTGVASAPTLGTSTNTGTVVAAYADATGIAKFVFISADTNDVGTTSAANTVFVVSASASTKYYADKDKNIDSDYYDYVVVKNGALDVVKATRTATAGFVAPTLDSKGIVQGELTGTTSAGDQQGPLYGTKAVADGFVKLGATAYTYTSATKVYTMTQDAATEVWSLEEGTVDSIADDANDVVYVISEDATKVTVAKTIYIVKVAEPTAHIVKSGDSLVAYSGKTVAATEKTLEQANNTVTYTYEWTCGGTVVGGDSSTLATATTGLTYTCTITCTADSGATYVWSVSAKA